MVLIKYVHLLLIFGAAIKSTRTYTRTRELVLSYRNVLTNVHISTHFHIYTYIDTYLHVHTHVLTPTYTCTNAYVPKCSDGLLERRREDVDNIFSKVLAHVTYSRSFVFLHFITILIISIRRF